MILTNFCARLLFVIDYHVLLVLEANWGVSLFVESYCLEFCLLLDFFPLRDSEQLFHSYVCTPHELKPADEFEFVLRQLVSHV